MLNTSRRSRAIPSTEAILACMAVYMNEAMQDMSILVLHQVKFWCLIIAVSTAFQLADQLTQACLQGSLSNFFFGAQNVSIPVPNAFYQVLHQDPCWHFTLPPKGVQLWTQLRIGCPRTLGYNSPCMRAAWLWPGVSSGPGPISSLPRHGSNGSSMTKTLKHC